MSNRIVVMVGLALAVVALGGCAGRMRRQYRDEAMDFGAIQKVAVLPFANLSHDQMAGERVRDVFSNALLATNAVYVVTPGDVARAVARVGIASPATPTSEEIVRLGEQLKVQAVVTGVIKEYGEVRTATSGSNILSMTLSVVETSAGKVVWSGSTTKGGISVADRLIGSGGAPLNDVTELAVDDLLDKLLK